MPGRAPLAPRPACTRLLLGAVLLRGASPGPGLCAGRTPRDFRSSKIPKAESSSCLRTTHSRHWSSVLFWVGAVAVQGYLPNVDLLRWVMFRYSALLTQGIAARRKSQITAGKWEYSLHPKRRTTLHLGWRCKQGFSRLFINKSLVPREGTATFHTITLVAGDEPCPKGGGVRAAPV